MCGGARRLVTGNDLGGVATYLGKGALFLRTLEEAVGRERFDKFLRAYFDTFAFQPMSAERMLADMSAKPRARSISAAVTAATSSR